MEVYKLLSALQYIANQSNDLIMQVTIEENERRRNFQILQFPTGKVLKGNKEEQKQTEKEESTAETAENDSPLFDEKEIKKMPQAFRKLFKVGRIRAHVRKRDDGRYEIRCQLNKTRLTASSTLLEIAKEKFIEKLNVIYNVKSAAALKNDDLMLENYMTNWLETVKKPYIKELTYKSYIQTATVHIYPVFGNKEINTITATELQKHINSFYNQEKFRTAKKVYQLLSALFDYALSDGVIERSPMKKVILGTYEQEHGSALTLDEEKTLIEALKSNPYYVYLQAYVLLLYTGLRRSELETIELSDDKQWISVVTAKQRKGKKEKRRNIPVPPMLKKVLNLIDFDRCKNTGKDYLTSSIKKVLPNHHLHDLRHSFVTRCQECGIKRELVSVWVGHTSNSITERVYTHLDNNRELQLTEITKFDYDF